MPFWTYMLHCRDRTFYVGHTDDLEARMAAHEQGAVPGYTTAKRPVTLVWSAEFPTREEAVAAERQIKGWSRGKKLALIRGDWAEISRLAKGGKGRPSTSSGRTVVGTVITPDQSTPHRPPVRPEPVEGSPFSSSHCLIPHHAAPWAKDYNLAARVERTASSLTLRYTVSGPINRLRIPAAAAPTRTDGLWCHTCFEAFLDDGKGYREFNFSPSCAWAAYSFTAYRDGMTPLDLAPPDIVVAASGERLELTVMLTLPGPAKGRMNLAAVIEDIEGRTSHWALKHPPGAADFHDPDCFVLELPAPETP